MITTELIISVTSGLLVNIVWEFISQYKIEIVKK